MNDRGKLYAMMYELPQTAGSDSHCVTDAFRCAIETKVKIGKPLDYLEMIRGGGLQIVEELQ